MNKQDLRLILADSYAVYGSSQPDKGPYDYFGTLRELGG